MTETAERTATEHWKKRQKAAVMAAWREGAGEAAHEARVLQVACRHWQQTLGAAAMRSWADAASELPPQAGRHGCSCQLAAVPLAVCSFPRVDGTVDGST